ncbi:hypothetical protein BCR42DRAFT_490404 [Absidia repens]|uniref:Phytanoyl-CoA dioxygenase n=1 Tax=Absidia repens TaxID=90262 RepID=A0A1X2IJE8_9FUNG|nr:hypothetical protein BCR42DRAFT_490404 [Absidia repens]
MMASLTSRHVEEFHCEGYTVLLNALSDDELTMLHDEADELSNYMMNEGYDLVRDFGSIVEPLECGYLDPPKSNESYKTNLEAFSKRRDELTPGTARFLTTTAGQWAGNLLYGDAHINWSRRRASQPVYLLNEQYIIKPPKTKAVSEFAWHCDSDYYREVSLQNELTVACWIALDDVNENNGTLLVGPLNDKSADTNANQQIKEIINIPAGSVVFMSSHIHHKSTGNASSRFRRVFMPQYSSRPLLNPQSFLPVALAVPLFPIS